MTPALSSLYIWLTNECNQRCAHCWINPVLEGRYEKPTPSFDDYRRLIDAALPLGLRFVKLTGGEALLREEVYPLLAHVSEVGARGALETNAMLVGEREAEFLARHGIRVSVSLDGSTPTVHDRRRGLEGAFERTWRALRWMVEAGVDLTVVTSVSRSNRAEVAEILELLAGLEKKARLDLKINPIIPIGRARKMAKRGDTLGAEDLLALVEEVWEEWTPQYREYGINILVQLELPFFPIDSLMKGAGRAGVFHCGFLNLISVLADGSLTFCGIGYHAPHLTMGNIRQEYDLADLWRDHPVLKEVRHTVHNALQGVCGDCLFQPMCLGGCRASALAVGGSIAASPPSCQALWDAGLFPVSRLREPAASRYAATRIAPLESGSKTPYRVGTARLERSQPQGVTS